MELPVPGTVLEQQWLRLEEDASTHEDGRGAVRCTVLCVEDNHPNLQLVEAALRRRPGTTLIAASDGREGVQLAREHAPDVILLDLHLPDIPGEEVLRLIRGDPATSGIPVVVVSADATEAHADQLRAAGALDYLTKPLDMARLLQVIDDTVEEIHR